ncbi:MAG TPA: hypothetical protein VLM38_18330, partial [Blastocatellia bacterium]|nr:hypothetical protein [Blastocatellia bacterium]
AVLLAAGSTTLSAIGSSPVLTLAVEQSFAVERRILFAGIQDLRHAVCVSIRTRELHEVKGRSRNVRGKRPRTLN